MTNEDAVFRTLLCPDVSQPILWISGQVPQLLFCIRRRNCSGLYVVGTAYRITLRACGGHDGGDDVGDVTGSAVRSGAFPLPRGPSGVRSVSLPPLMCVPEVWCSGSEVSGRLEWWHG